MNKITKRANTNDSSIVIKICYFKRNDGILLKAS